MNPTTPSNSLCVESRKDNTSKLTIDDLYNLIIDEFEATIAKFPEHIKKERTEGESIVEPVEWFIKSVENSGFKVGYDGLNGFCLNDGNLWRPIEAYDLREWLSFIGCQMGFPYPACDYYKYRRQLLEQLKEMAYSKELAINRTAIREGKLQ